MKTKIRISAMIAIAGALMILNFSSCVSTKKYNDALSKNADTEVKLKYLQTQQQVLQREYNELEAAKNKLQSSSSEALKNKAAELYEKEIALQERERKIKELTADMQSARNALFNLKQEVCDALKCFTPDELTIEVRDGKLYVSMSDKLLFPSGSDMVNERGREAITMLTAVLANSKLEIMVEGHTDMVPISSSRNKDNWDLSVHRATSVTRIFTDNGIDPTRIIAGGRGEFHPLASNDSPDGRQRNRRTEIVLAPKLDKLWDLTEQEPVSRK